MLRNLILSVKNTAPDLPRKAINPLLHHLNSLYGKWLKLYWISSCRQLTRIWSSSLEIWWWT